MKVSWAGPAIADDGASSDDNDDAEENGDVNSRYRDLEPVSVNDEPINDHVELVNFDDTDVDDDEMMMENQAGKKTSALT